MSLATLINLSPQARKIHDHMVKAGSISAREAMGDYGITSATLARRICDLEGAGIAILRETREHPIHKRKYTRYSIKPVEPGITGTHAETIIADEIEAPFKVGDRVRLKDDFVDEEDAGKVGSIMKAYPPGAFYPFTVLLDGQATSWPVRANEIDKVSA